jgi:hypothetical protein
MTSETNVLLIVITTLVAIASAADSPERNRKLIEADAPNGKAVQEDVLGRKKFHPYTSPSGLFIQVRHGLSLIVPMQ